MKDYSEVAKDVLERRDAYAAARKKRAKAVRKAAIWTAAAAGAAGVCLAVLRTGTIPQEGGGIPMDAVLSAQESLADAGESASAAGQENYGGDSAAISDSAVDGGSSGVSNGSAGRSSSAVSSGAADGDSSGVSNDAADSGLLPVSYSSLHLAQGQIKPEIAVLWESSQSTADILPFQESMLSDCCAILEGTVTDMYLKEYAYDTYGDKFGTTEVYHNLSSSFVYELSVSKVWYGDQSLTGTSVLIEDEVYLMDSYFSLKAGCSYVIPIRDVGEQKTIWQDYAGGDLTRDSRYATLYPHHPQIEVTLDGDYVVTDDWETLCSGAARDIDLEISYEGTQSPYQDTFIEYHPENQAGEDGLITTEWRTLLISRYDAGYYYDKLKLVKSDEFFIRLNEMIAGLP